MCASIMLSKNIAISLETRVFDRLQVWSSQTQDIFSCKVANKRSPSCLCGEWELLAKDERLQKTWSIRGSHCSNDPLFIYTAYPSCSAWQNTEGQKQVLRGHNEKVAESCKDGGFFKSIPCTASKCQILGSALLRYIFTWALRTANAPTVGSGMVLISAWLRRLLNHVVLVVFSWLSGHLF